MTPKRYGDGISCGRLVCVRARDVSLGLGDGLQVAGIVGYARKWKARANARRRPEYRQPSKKGDVGCFGAQF
jgi:hypothetical protein